MILLVLVKEDKTKFQLTSSTIYEVGDITSTGYLVLEKRFYYKGSFLSFQELYTEYWKEIDERCRKRHKKRFLIFFKKR